MEMNIELFFMVYASDMDKSTTPVALRPATQRRPRPASRGYFPEYHPVNFLSLQTPTTGGLSGLWSLTQQPC